MDWSYDTPARHYITVYRVLVTAAGSEDPTSATTGAARTASSDVAQSASLSPGVP